MAPSPVLAAAAAAAVFVVVLSVVLCRFDMKAVYRVFKVDRS